MATCKGTEVRGGGAALREAIDRAAPGDVLCVAPGVYAGPFVVERAVTIEGTAGREETVLEGAGEGTLVFVEAREGRIVLQGLTLRGGGDAKSGGGIALPNGGDLVLRDVVVRGSVSSKLGGGGLSARRGTVLVEGSLFEGNRGRRGGAAFLQGRVRATFRRCTFVGNAGEDGGGAIGTSDEAEVLVEESVFERNEAPRGASVLAAPGPRAEKPVVLEGSEVRDGGARALAVQGPPEPPGESPRESRKPGIVVRGGVLPREARDVPGVAVEGEVREPAREPRRGD